MKTIIAEKPSVAREIARIVGATEREEGYFTGNGYNVTWTFGPDHHAIIITGEQPKHMSNEDMTIYDMIVGRMLEAFSEKCIKDITQVTADCCGITFTAKGSVIKKEGWRYIYGTDKKDVLLPADWNEGDMVTVNSSSLTTGQTKPKPLHTEASLLAAMETCGKELTGDGMKELITNGKIGVLKGFKSKQGKKFSAIVAFDCDFNTQFIFPK